MCVWDVLNKEEWRIKKSGRNCLQKQYDLNYFSMIKSLQIQIVHNRACGELLLLIIHECSILDANKGKHLAQIKSRWHPLYWGCGAEISATAILKHYLRYLVRKYAKLCKKYVKLCKTQIECTLPRKALSLLKPYNVTARFIHLCSQNRWY